jgi:protein gp37
MGLTSIEWTDASWNPVRGCEKVSPGCKHCYAETVAARFSGPGQPYEGLVKLRASGKHGRAVWNGKVRMVDDHLADPLRWKRPRRVFVNSMSDLFHEGLTNEQIAAVFGVMAAAPRHTFQILTKRAERMREWFEWMERRAVARSEELGTSAYAHADVCQLAALDRGVEGVLHPIKGTLRSWPWPLPNVWLGVSVEDQQRADERIPHLLATPAAVRFLSVEPLLGPVDLRTVTYQTDCRACAGRGTCGICDGGKVEKAALDALDWVIVGGESGPGARPCRIGWIRSIVEQCRGAGVPCFVKQLGAVSLGLEHGHRSAQWESTTTLASGPRLLLANRKGGDPSEWPADLNVRQFPEAR